MRKLIVAAFISLDGVFNPPVGLKKIPAANSASVAGLCPTPTRPSAKPCRSCSRSRSSCCWGRRTYDIFAAYWPHVRADSASHAIADLFNSVPKHVATHRSDTLDWQNSHALEGTLPTRYARLNTRTTASTY